MNKLRIGNVIKTKYGYIEIVTDVRDDYTNTVSLNYSNVSSGYKTKDTKRKVECNCVDMCGHAMPDCPKCKGTGQVEQTRYGSDSATLIANNVKEYILDSLTKNFNF